MPTSPRHRRRASYQFFFPILLAKKHRETFDGAVCVVPLLNQNLEIRVESFNVLNHFNWGNPGTNFSAATFGRIPSLAGSPRIMQFGVKYGF